MGEKSKQIHNLIEYLEKMLKFYCNLCLLISPGIIEAVIIIYL